MAATTFSQKALLVIPPMKGSFPLDHEGECKLKMMLFMKCMSYNDQNTAACRLESMDYLSCRMDRSLMTREEWRKLGFQPDEIKTYNSRKEVAS